jgi:hypothetical protein
MNYFRNRLSQQSNDPSDTSDTTKGKIASKDMSYHEVFTQPIPVGRTSSGDPYFAPPVNFPPIPSGYTEDGIPYYNKTPTVQFHPLGVTLDGLRYYSAEGKVITPDTPSRSLTGGYDYFGFPFYIPRGLYIPTPAGYTSDGIPFYDIPSMLLHSGNMLLPREWRSNDANFLLPEEKIDFLLGKKEAKSELEHLIVDFLKDVNQSHNQLIKRMTECNLKTIKANSPLQSRLSSGFRSNSLDAFQEPADLRPILKNIDQFAYVKPNTMKVTLEPSSITFQSVATSVTKPSVIRFRASRGDRETREYFVSVNPTGVFSTNVAHLNFQGEGVQELDLTFNPHEMQTDKLEGAIHLIDDSGKCVALTSITAIKRPFFQVNHTLVNSGWVLPGKEKQVFVSVTNLHSLPVTLNLNLESLRNSSDTSTETGSRSFQIAKSSIRLQGSETTQISIQLIGNIPGNHQDCLEISGPGGSFTRVLLTYTCGTPLVVLSESADEVRMSASDVAQRRTQSLKKFSGLHGRSASISRDEASILRTIIASSVSISDEETSQVIDFGICAQDGYAPSRYLTLFNLGNTSITVSLYSRNPVVACESIIRIPAKSARTTEVNILRGQAEPAVIGIFSSHIDIKCSEIELSPVKVQAFIGNPVFLPVWENIFFKPCKIGQTDSLSLPLVNKSQYVLDFRVNVIIQDSERESSIACSTCQESTMRVQAFSSVPLNFLYEGRDIGPLMGLVDVEVINLDSTPVRLPLGCSGRSCFLLGFCFEPKPFAAEREDKIGLDFMRNWMSSTDKIADLYPKTKQRRQNFDCNVQHKDLKSEINLNGDDPLVFEMPGR